MTRWVALLRGVNVGGGNKVAMPALRESLESLGVENVATYIQSGNIVLDAPGTEAEIVAAISGVLASRHGLRVPVVVRTAKQVAEIAGRHPDADSEIEPKLLHVQFLDKAIPASARDLVDLAAYLPDTFHIDGREIYLAYPGGSGRSKLTIEVFERAHGVIATARNLNTVRALAALAATA